MCQNRKQNNSLEGELVRNVRTRKRLTEKPSPRLVRMPPLLKAEGGRSRTMLEKKKKKKGFPSPGHKWEGKHKFGEKLIFYPKKALPSYS